MTTPIISWPTGQREISLGEAVEAWLASAAPFLRPVTLADYRRAAARWVRLHGARGLLDLGEEELAGMLGGPDLGPRTRGKELRYLRAFWNWARRRYGLGPGLPIDALRVRAAPPRSIRTVQDDELGRILLAAEGHEFRAYIVIAIETGLRRRTLLSMRWENLDLEAGWIRLPGAMLKSGRDLSVPLSPAAGQAFLGLFLRLQDAPPDARCFSLARWGVTRAWARACRAAGVVARLHDLRKTFISRAAWRGVPIEVVMQLSDHRSLETVLAHYRQVRPEELLRAVGRPLPGKEAAG